MYVTSRASSPYKFSGAARAATPEAGAASSEQAPADERGPLTRAADTALAGVMVASLSVGKAGSWIGGRRVGEAAAGKVAEWTGADPESSRTVGAALGRGLGAGVIGGVVLGGLATALGRSGVSLALTAATGFLGVANFALVGEIFKIFADRCSPEAAQQVRNVFD